MTGATSSLCASRVTQGYTQREVTDGMDEGVIRMNKSEHPFVISPRIDFSPPDGKFIVKRGRGGQNRHGCDHRATVPPLRVYFLRI